jgi:hypothetical protein
MSNEISDKNEMAKEKIEPSEDFVVLSRVSFFEGVYVVCIWRLSGVALNRAGSQDKKM